MSTFARLEELALSVARCPRCYASAGVRCRTKTGNRAKLLHAGRVGPFYEAWRIGYREGGNDATTIIDQGIADTLRATEDSSGRGNLATAVQRALMHARRAFSPS